MTSVDDMPELVKSMCLKTKLDYYGLGLIQFIYK